MSIENGLRGFISSREAGALVLQGKWGLGKTYFWRQRIIKPFLANDKIPKDLKRYSYVSMFGVESLSDLKVAIFQAANEFDSELLASGWRFVNPKWLWWKGKQILPFALDNAALPYVREGLAKTYNALTFYSVRNRLICLDDLERRGSGLSLLDVLGLVSQLAEQRGCRVVVILNTGALNEVDQKVWDAHKEKVFFGEMTFSPTVAECIDLGLDDARTESWTPIARDRLLYLGVANIRIIYRVKRCIQRALASVVDRQLRPETVDRITRVLVMLVFSHSGKAEGAPPIYMVMGTGPFDYALFRMSKEEKSDDEKRWLELISDYDIYFGEDLDKALARLVVAGYPDAEELSSSIERFEDAAQAQADKEAWHNAWRLYHDTLADNADELADTFERTWPAVARAEHANNLQSLTRLLRKLGRPDVASRFIGEWIAHRGGDRIEELGPDHFHMFGAITDPEILVVMATAYATDRSLPSVPDALRRMGSEHGMDREAIAALAAAPSLAIVQALDANPGRYLTGAITNTLKLGDHPQEPAWAIARQNMREALIQVAARSSLSADRMSNKFGIRLDDVTESGDPSSPVVGNTTHDQE